MRPHENLDVWKKAVELALVIYKLSERFPKDERFGLTSQVRRAAVSVSANIAEGAARRSSKEFAYFLSNAQGSASELDTELLIAHRLGYIDRADYLEARNLLDDISRMITGLSRHLQQRTYED